MDIVYGSSTGIVKGFSVEGNRNLVHVSTLKNTKISSLCWNPSQNSIFLGTSNGSVLKQDLISHSSSTLIPGAGDQVIALLPQADSIFCARSSGSMTMYAIKDFNPKCEFSAPSSICAAKSHDSLLAVGGKNCNLTIWDVQDYTKPIFSAKNCRPTTLQLETPIWISDICFIPKHDGRIVLTASRHGDLSLYDLRCGQRRPVSRHAWRMSKKYGKVKVGRCSHGAILPDLSTTRPITRAMAFDDAPGIGIRVVAGNAIGDVCFLDMRLPEERVVVSSIDDITPIKPYPGLIKSRGTRAPEVPLSVRAMKGASGSITGLACGGADCGNFPIATNSSIFNSQPVLIVSSLDRYLRFYNRDTGDRIAKVYTKVPISSFVINDRASFADVDKLGEKPPQQPTEGGEENIGEEQCADEEEDEEYDELWDQMEHVEEELPPPTHKQPVDGSRKSLKRKRHN